MTTTARSPAMGLSRADFDAYRPVFGLIVVQRETPEAKAGSIILPDKPADERRKVPTFARVIRTGDLDVDKKGRPIPLLVKAGDRVVIDAYAGHDVEIKETGERFVILGEPEIFGIASEEEDDEVPA